MPREIKNPGSKLGILIPGLGAISTTFIAGVHSIRCGLTKPVGSITQMQTIRLGKRTEGKTPLIKDFVPLTSLDDLVFGAWDIFRDNGYEAAKKAKVLNAQDLRSSSEFLQSIRPMKAVFDKKYVKNLDGNHIKTGKTKWELAQQLTEDINEFRTENRTYRNIMIWCASTEVFLRESDVHQSIEIFEKALKENHSDISPSMIYAYAALMSDVPFINGAPNLTVDIPALTELAELRGIPIAGKDFKTGQTLMKTIIAPGLKSRMLGVKGWFSTNLLGNRDGEVLDDQGSFRTKEESKLGALESIMQPKLYPQLYGDMHHKVRINYYPPRGDEKEGWDNIDIFGWMGYPMQIKVNFLCRDSILAAPIVLDLVLFTDLALRAGMKGIQEWLSFYFKSPMTAPELYAEHDLFIQLTKLKNTLRWMKGEELITHLGTEYYDHYY
jgi:myo-inositol-1-phosphate synthase